MDMDSRILPEQNTPVSENTPSPQISVVIPVYNENENLEILMEELTAVLNETHRSYEVILVDDGSTDKSFQIMEKMAGRDRRVTVIRFKRNAGQSAAFDAGFRLAKGEIVVTLDSDLQNDPRDIPLLLEKMGEYDMVCGVRTRRIDSWIRLASSKIANYVRNTLSDEEVTDTGCSLKAYRGEFLKRLKLFNGVHRFFPTLMKMEGARVTEIPVHHRPRKFGKSKYNIRNRLLRSLLDLLAVRWMKKRRLQYEIEKVIHAPSNNGTADRTGTLLYEVLDPADRL
jgi:glycosyltransferase involved in cell wall biosynthesis